MNLNSENKQTLTNQVQAVIDKKYQTLKRHIDKYGDRWNLCIRYKGPKKPKSYQIGDKSEKLPPYKIAWVSKFKYLPKRTKDYPDLCISHICGRQSCINTSHMMIEPQSINSERFKCHEYITNFLDKYSNKIKVKRGQITVEYVNVKYEKIDKNKIERKCTHVL